MGVLSNQEIEKALANDELVIDPTPSPGPGVPGSPYDECSVNLHLGDTLRIPKTGEDKKRLGLAWTLRLGTDPKSTLSVVTQNHVIQRQYVLAPNEFVLAQTEERVSLPFPRDGSSRCLAARIEGRSRFARTGLLVHFTAPTIHTGFDGPITLELMNLGPFDFVLEPGLPLCQLIVETVDGVPIKSADGEFESQRSPVG